MAVLLCPTYLRLARYQSGRGRKLHVGRLSPAASAASGAKLSENHLFDLQRTVDALEVGFMLAWDQWAQTVGLAGGRGAAHVLVRVRER